MLVGWADITAWLTFQIFFFSLEVRASGALGEGSR